MQTLTAKVAAPARPLPMPRVTKKPRDNEPTFDIRTLLHQLTGGVDLTQLDGITPYTALKLISEIGTDMRRWPTEKHFTSWLTLAPKNKVSGGRLLSSRTQPSTARKLAILIYRTLRGELVSHDPGADAYDTQQRTRILRRLRQRAENLGFTLVSRETGEILDGVVS